MGEKLTCQMLTFSKACKIFIFLCFIANQLTSQTSFLLNSSKDSKIRKSRTSIDGSIYLIGKSAEGGELKNAQKNTIPLSPNSFYAKLDSSGKVQYRYILNSSECDIRGLATDDEGNFYIAGNLGEALGSFKANDDETFYLAKINKDFQVQWVKSALSNSMFPEDIEINKAGELYATGRVFKSLTINEPSKSFKIDLNGDDDIFCAKFSLKGELSWMKSFGGSSTKFPKDYGYSDKIQNFKEGGQVLCINPQGGCFIGGAILQDAKAEGLKISVNGTGDAFVASIDADGKVLWLNSFGTTAKWGNLYDRRGLDLVYGMAYAKEKLVVTGVFFGNTLYWDNQKQTTSTLNAFVGCLNKNGKSEWLKLSNTTNEYASEGTSVMINASDEILAVGIIPSGDLSFYGVKTKPQNQMEHLYLLKLNLEGTILDLFNPITPAKNRITEIRMDRFDHYFISGCEWEYGFLKRLKFLSLNNLTYLSPSSKQSYIDKDEEEQRHELEIIAERNKLEQEKAPNSSSALYKGYALVSGISNSGLKIEIEANVLYENIATKDPIFNQTTYLKVVKKWEGKRFRYPNGSNTWFGFTPDIHLGPCTDRELSKLNLTEDCCIIKGMVFYLSNPTIY